MISSALLLLLALTVSGLQNSSSNNELSSIETSNFGKDNNNNNEGIQENNIMNYYQTTEIMDTVETDGNRDSYDQQSTVIHSLLKEPPISVKVLVGEKHALSVSEMSTNKRLPELATINNMNVYSIAYHYKQNLIFFAAQDRIFSATLYGKARMKDSKVIVNETVDGPVRLAVDWVNNKLYWMADNYQTLERSDLDGQSRDILVDNRQNFSYPNNIVVDPYKKLLFYVSNYSVFTTPLDKINVSEVVLEGDVKVRCIAIDKAKEKLYYTGRYPDDSLFLARINYDGGKHQYFETAGFNDIFSMDVLGKTLYFGNYGGKQNDGIPDVLWSTNTNSLDISNARKRFVPRNSISVMWSIKVYHPCDQLTQNDSNCLHQNI